MSETELSLDEKEVVAVRKILYRVAAGEISDKNKDLGPIEAANQFIDRVDKLEQQVEELETELEMIEQDASTALGVANETSDGARADGGPSDQKRAEWLSRNEVVRRAITGNRSGGAVTATEVKSMARPETELFNKQVYRAWGNLATKWQALEYERRDDDPNRLKANADALAKDLVRVVERDLGRDDLIEQLEEKRHRKTKP